MKLRILLMIAAAFYLPEIEMKPFELTIKAIKPFPNTKAEFVSYGDLRISKKARNTYVLTGSFSLLKNMGNEFKAKYEALRQDSNGVYRVFMSSGANFCDFLKKETVIYPGIKAASNMPDGNTCPFPKGNYTINNFVQDESKLPELVPGGEWILRCWFELNNEVQGGYILEATIKY